MGLVLLVCGIAPPAAALLAAAFLPGAPAPAGARGTAEEQAPVMVSPRPDAGQ